MPDAAGKRPATARATFTVISVWPVPGVLAGLTAGRCLAQVCWRYWYGHIDANSRSLTSRRYRRAGQNRPSDWLDFHPLTNADLVTESELLAAIGYSLTVNSRALG
jgi:hypothetical protein